MSDTASVTSSVSSKSLSVITPTKRGIVSDAVTSPSTVSVDTTGLSPLAARLQISKSTTVAKVVEKVKYNPITASVGPQNAVFIENNLEPTLKYKTGK